MFGWFKKRKKEEAIVDSIATPIEQAPQEIGPTKNTSHAREAQSEWEELFNRVEASTDLHVIKPRIICEKRKYIVGHRRVVIYLEDKYNPKVNAFIAKYYDDIMRGFERIGFVFVYAPKEVEKVAKEYAAPIPDVEWNAETILDLFYCRLYEPMGSALVVIDETRNYHYVSHNQAITTVLKGGQMDADTEEELMALFKAYWKRLEEDYCIPPIVSRPSIVFEEQCDYKRVTGNLFTANGESAQSQRDEELRQVRERKIREAEERKCMMSTEKGRSDSFFKGFVKKIKTVDANEVSEDFLLERDGELKCMRRQASISLPEPETLTKEDEQLLSEILERVEKLRHTGIRQHLIEQMVRMTVKPSPLQVTSDARLLLTDYGKEVVMLPIDKVVYIFYLRHPEGVAIKLLEEHKEELTDIYSRILGNKRLTTKQRKSIERLCDPLDNSINEKISRIRQAFRAVAHDSVANCYIIRGERGEKRSISLNEELIELGEWGRR